MSEGRCKARLILASINSFHAGGSDERDKLYMYGICADPSGPGVGNICRLVNDATILGPNALPCPSVS